MDCKLERLRDQDLDAGVRAALDTLRDRYGMSPEAVATLVGDVKARASRGAHGLARELYGDLTACRSVRVNRVLSAVNAVVLLGLLGVVLVVMHRELFSMSSSRLWGSMWGLGMASTVLLLVQFRHGIILLLKLAWWGFGTNARLVLLLLLLSTAASSSLDYAKFVLRSRGIVLVLLGVVAMVTLAKVVATVRGVVHPESAVLIPTLTALNRVLSAKKIAQLSKLL